MPPVIILNVVTLNCDALVEKQTQNFGKLFIIKPVYKYHLCLHTLSDCHCTQLWEAGLAAECLTMGEQGVVQQKTFFFFVAQIILLGTALFYKSHPCNLLRG